MKHYFLALSLLLAGTTAAAQPATPAPITLSVEARTHRIAYSGIIAVPGASKNELYARGKIWFGTDFYLAQRDLRAIFSNGRVLQTDDKEAGVVAAKGFYATYINHGFIGTSNRDRVNFQYTVKLSFEEGNYCYLLTDFQFLSGRPDPTGGLTFGVFGFISMLIPLAVEPVFLAKHNDGTPTRRAARFSKALDQHVQGVVASLESGMSKAAGDSAW